MRAPRIVTSLLIVLLGLSTTACSKTTDYGPMGSVTGKLTIDGKAIDQGTQLLFMKMDAGYAAFGETDAEGNYSITWARDGERKSEVPLGSYKVLIQPPRVGKDTEEMSAEEMLEGGDVAPAKPKFPAKYQQHATSGLEFTVKEGENKINIDLKSK
ncbi:hypothetical protein [Gimesia fumaroli]|jgi:hypothetical protein|uniref:Carboxypeptidase regulatory-like domain-containing protein n=1 Tax=Gimesia fumaroli TaxID=2527976 RepID=A0A518IF75_9PLAN|nr:hypothetical protein [Gimesia fumaroli]QDV51735.1 hypothetical protein Enr17x_37930 [Gimesia fumaroli]